MKKGLCYNGVTWRTPRVSGGVGLGPRKSHVAIGGPKPTPR